MTSHILYIEDNPDNTALVRRALEARGYRMSHATTGLKGIAAIQAEPIDLVLLDINLPDIDGYEVVRRLRSSNKPEVALVPVIAITANALRGDAEKALLSGCNMYMSKPINLRELWARVESYIPAPK